MATRDVTGFAGDVRTRLEDADLGTLLLLPIVALELGTFVAPFVLLVRISLYENTRISFYEEGTWTLSNYATVFADSYLQGRFLVTLEIAAIATAATLVIGTFFAYVIWRSAGWLKAGLIVAMILPMLTTLVVKLYTWVLLLAPLGTVNDVLLGARVVNEPVVLMSNRFGVVVGLVYTTLPYTVLPIYAVLANMEWEILEAARVHGAGEVRSFVEVILPAAIPGVIVATVLTLVWNFGAFAAPGLLGSGAEQTLAMEVDYYLQRFNWPLSAALSFTMFAFVIVSTIVLFNLLGRWGGGMEDVT